MSPFSCLVFSPWCSLMPSLNGLNIVVVILLNSSLGRPSRSFWLWNKHFEVCMCHGFYVIFVSSLGLQHLKWFGIESVLLFKSPFSSVGLLLKTADSNPSFHLRVVDACANSLCQKVSTPLPGPLLNTLRNGSPNLHTLESTGG